jgi:adenine-specific DNA-methyltransferase
MNGEPDKVALETADLAARNRAAFAELFPGLMADGVLDAAMLAELLGLEVALGIENRERFGLQWAGKQDAVRSLLTPSRATLAPDLARSIDFDNARNVFIEGDNLEVLKLLQKAYNDKVKLIYIDPPYNTGNDFVYADDFSDGLRGYLEYTGQLDEDGNRATASLDRAGRYHSKWLSMMFPRLLLARNLMTQDGLLVVSIDDNEVTALRLVLDEVFGPENFVATFVWVSNIKGRQISGAGPAGTKEYLHVYARNKLNIDDFRASASFLKELMPSVYKGFNYDLKSDDRGPYVTKNELYNTNSAFNEATRPNLVYDIYYNPATGEIKTEPVSPNHVHAGMDKITPKQNNNGVNKYHAYRWGREKVLAEGYDLEFRKSADSWRIFTKVRDVDSTSVKDLFMDVSTSNGSADLKSIGIDPAWFDYPKPVGLLQILIDIATDRDSVVMDFFAGSGSTAHAVAVQNARDGGSRKSLIVTLPETLPEDSEARSAGHEFITDITYERLLAVAEKVEASNPGGLRVLSLGPSNFRTRLPLEDQIDLSTSTLADDVHDMRAVAAEVFLREGVPLSEPWGENQFGNVSTFVSGGVAVVVGQGLAVATAERIFALEPAPRVIVFLEDNLAGQDALKANLLANAKSRGMTVKTI